MVLFWVYIIYTFPIMSIDRYEEHQLERQVDQVFQDAQRPVRDRREFAAFALAEFINEERLAQDKQMRVWQEKDAPQPRSGTGPVPPLETQIAAKFLYISGYQSIPVPDMIYADEPEFSDEPTELSLKREALAEAREKIGRLYELTPRQMRGAERLSRRQL